MQETPPGAQNVKGNSPKTKRRVKFDVEEADYDHGHGEPKRRKAGISEGIYCFCGGPDSGRMIACDNQECTKQWFHFACAALEKEADKDRNWLCGECEQ
jgi:hypothetical protein